VPIRHSGKGTEGNPTVRRITLHPASRSLRDFSEESYGQTLGIVGTMTGGERPRRPDDNPAAITRLSRYGGGFHASDNSRF
jgi:hypothetical protein